MTHLGGAERDGHVFCFESMFGESEVYQSEHHTCLLIRRRATSSVARAVRFSLCANRASTTGAGGSSTSGPGTSRADASGPGTSRTDASGPGTTRADVRSACASHGRAPSGVRWRAPCAYWFSNGFSHRRGFPAGEGHPTAGGFASTPLQLAMALANRAGRQGDAERARWRLLHHGIWSGGRRRCYRRILRRR